MRLRFVLPILLLIILAFAVLSGFKNETTPHPKAVLVPTKKFLFNSFVDCNMAEAWVGDTFRIFPGKYGEDPLWGYSDNLQFANGKNADEAFLTPAEHFIKPTMPPNVLPGTKGLHGAVWFETIYQDSRDKTGKTLYAVYHNENYPNTLPYDAKTGEGYQDKNWPQGLTGKATPAAVCRMGIMKSTNGGYSWENKGIVLEDLQPRMILKLHNTSVNFGGGVGDPSAIASGNYLYLFFSEYGYPGTYDSLHYDPVFEHKGQCISIARIALSDLDNPTGKAKRWDGAAFTAPYNGVGKPITNLQIPAEEGGGPTSSPTAKFYWGPSISWNTYLHAWVLLMAKAESPSWKGSSIYISYNTNENLGEGKNSQQWSKPELLFNKPNHIIWYPSLQPQNTADDIANKYTCLKLGQTARLFFKDILPDSSEYASSYLVRFDKH